MSNPRLRTVISPRMCTQHQHSFKPFPNLCQRTSRRFPYLSPQSRFILLHNPRRLIMALPQSILAHPILLITLGITPLQPNPPDTIARRALHEHSLPSLWISLGLGSLDLSRAHWQSMAPRGGCAGACSRGRIRRGRDGSSREKVELFRFHVDFCVEDTCRYHDVRAR
jgi:hypothetical protein